MVAPGRRDVSLHFAVADIGRAVDGCRLLVEALSDERFIDARDERQASEACASLLGLLVCHVENIERVLRDEVDSRVVSTPSNRAPQMALEGRDIILNAWEPRRGASTYVATRSKRKGRR